MPTSGDHQQRASTHATYAHGCARWRADVRADSMHSTCS